MRVATKAPAWRVCRPAPWSCARGEHARLNGFKLEIRVWRNGGIRALISHNRGGAAGGWTTAADFIWPPSTTEGKEKVTLSFAREWCEREARRRPKANAEG